MNGNKETVNLRTLQELILDEEKLVTYICASKELCLHVNVAKMLLQDLVTDLRKKKPVIYLNVNYIVSGLTENNAARTIVCTEKDVELIMKTFSTVFFKHIYSVSKGLPNYDRANFVSINKFEDIPICTGLIKNDICCKHTSEEIGSLKSSSQELIKQIKVNYDKAQVAQITESKSEPNIKQETISPQKDKKDHIMKSSIKQSNVKLSTNKVAKGIAGFFNKSNSAQNAKMKNECSEKLDENETGAKTKINVNIGDQKPKAIESMITDSIRKKSTDSSLKQIKINAKLDKKRKRVLHISDSESDNEKDPFGENTIKNDESEDEIPPTPTINTIKVTSGLTNPKKKRKVVDKTYTDEEGYILTKKVEIYDSCSDNEETNINLKENVEKSNSIKTDKQCNYKNTSPQKKKNKSPQKNKKKSPPQKGKQSTINNFFKKVPT